MHATVSRLATSSCTTDGREHSLFGSGETTQQCGSQLQTGLSVAIKAGIIRASSQGYSRAMGRAVFGAPERKQ